MTTKLSTEQLPPAVASDLILFRAVEAGSSVAAAQTAKITSRLEPSKVIYVAFGEWPVPKIDHPDSACMGKFVQELEALGHTELLASGRQEIAAWFDKKTTLRTLRLAAGLSQDQLAALMQTSQPQIARIESGKQDPSLRTLEKLAQALNTSIHDVVDAAS